MLQEIKDAYFRRRSTPTLRGSQFFGAAPAGFTGNKVDAGGFGFIEGLKNKYEVFPDGNVSWRGMSGVLQFISKFPFGYLSKSDWAKTLNQIFWNITIFIVLFGFIYAALIQGKHIGVPEESIAQQTSAPVTATGEVQNDNALSQGFYFAAVTTTTLGFGDISPSTLFGQFVVMMHIILFMLFNFIFVLDFGVPE